MSSLLSPDDLRHLRVLFLDEAGEHLQAIDEALGALEAAPSDGAALAALLRKVHTLKGSAGTIELDEVARAAHELEDGAVAIRASDRAPGRDEVAALVTASGRLQRAIDEVARLHGPPARLTTPIAGRPSGERRASDALQVRVEAGRLDELVEAAGELVLDRTRIDRNVLALEGGVRDLGRAREALGRALAEAGIALEAVTTEIDAALGRLRAAAEGLAGDADHLRQTAQILDDGLKRVRMMEIGRLFSRLAGPVRDLGRRAGKEVELVTRGEHTAIDKAIVERVSDPILHLLRNAIAHGIEPAAARIAAGKRRAGRLELSARWRGAELLVEVADDGAGVDVAAVRDALVRAGRLTDEAAARLSAAQAVAAIFEPGISTRIEADDLAGRGVGLDAVREEIALLGGTVSCASVPGAGTRFTVRLPLTSTIARALLFKVGGRVYAVPSESVRGRAKLPPDAVRAAERSGVEQPAFAGLPETGERAILDGRALPLVRLAALLGEPPPPGEAQVRWGVLLAHEGVEFVVTCDKVVGDRQIVVQGLGPLLAALPLYAGATISGAGKVQLLLDVAALAELAARPASLGARPPDATGGPRVLVVDDSRSLRETVAAILAQAGYRVETSADGAEALELLHDRRFDVLLTDGEMPGLDGYALTAEVRRSEALRALPVVLMTSRDAETTELRAHAAGADEFLAKPLRRQALVEAVAAALARRA